MVLGRVYRAVFSKVAITVPQDLFELTAPSTCAVALLGWGLGQSSDTGDAQEENLNIAVKSGATTSGSGGSTLTPAPNSKGDPASIVTVEANNTTKASTGTIVTHDVQEVNVRVGDRIMYLPEDIKVVSPSGRLTIELIDAPIDSITASGFVVYAEIGG